MLSSFGVMDQTARGQLVSTLFLPVPMVAAPALGIAVALSGPVVSSSGGLLMMGTGRMRW
jgi:hypothetical protein